MPRNDLTTQFRDAIHRYDRFHADHAEVIRNLLDPVDFGLFSAKIQGARLAYGYLSEFKHKDSLPSVIKNRYEPHARLLQAVYSHHQQFPSIPSAVEEALVAFIADEPSADALLALIIKSMAGFSSYYPDLIIGMPQARIIEEEIGYLSKNESEILKGLYGIQREAATMARLMKQLGISRKHLNVIKLLAMENLCDSLDARGVITREPLAFHALVQDERATYALSAMKTSASREYDPLTVPDVLSALFAPLAGFRLGARLAGVLRRHDLLYLGDLLYKDEYWFLSKRNFGRRTLKELKDLMSRYGLRFGMPIPPDVDEAYKRARHP